MKNKIKSYEQYAYCNNGYIRHKDSFGQELKVGDIIIVGGYLGNLYKAKIIGDTNRFIVINYYFKYNISFSKYPSLISPNKTYKID